MPSVLFVVFLIGYRHFFVKREVRYMHGFRLYLLPPPYKLDTCMKREIRYTEKFNFSFDKRNLVLMFDDVCRMFEYQEISSLCTESCEGETIIITVFEIKKSEVALTKLHVELIEL